MLEELSEGEAERSLTAVAVEVLEVVGVVQRSALNRIESILSRQVSRSLERWLVMRRRVICSCGDS